MDLIYIRQYYKCGLHLRMGMFELFNVLIKILNDV
jgi:hypothetical protein